MTFPPPTPGQARMIWIAVTALAVTVFLGILAAVVWGMGWMLNLLSPVVWPLAIGGILAYLLDPVVDFFARRRISRGLSILLVFALCALAIGAFMASVTPRLVREAARLVAEVPAYSKQAQEGLNRWMSRRPMFDDWRKRLFPGQVQREQATNAAASPMPPEAGATNQVAAPPAAKAEAEEHAWVDQISAKAVEWLSATLPKIGRWLLTQLSRIASFAGTIISLALVPVFTYYFLLEKKVIVESWTKYLPVRESRFKEELVFIINAINNALIVFFRGQVVVAMCIGVLLTIGFLALGLNYAVLLGVMAGVLSIIPYLGAILTIIPAVILAAVQFRDVLHPALVIGVFALVQMIEGFVISPKIMGDRVGLHPLTIMVALLVGTSLMGGILGGILAIPLTAALREAMFRYVWRRRRREQVAA